MADVPARGNHGRAYARPGAPESAVTRGQFLTLSSVGLGAMIGAVIGVPATAYVLAPVVDKVEFTPVKIGKVSDFPTEGGQFKPKAATFVEDAQNPNTSATLAWVHNTGKSDTSDWRASDAMFVIFSNRCMHLGCPVVATLTGFGCPCHGGQYDKNGIRIAGPPIRPLDRFEWQVRNKDELWVTNRWSVEYVDGQPHYYEVKMPGQPITFPGSNLLYPDVTYDYPKKS